MTRFVVVEGVDAASAAAIGAELGAQLYTVADSASAASVVLVALGGADLVVHAVAERDVIDRLCDDLRRLGRLDHRVGADSRPVLSADERALLAHLLAGRSLGEAARVLHLSRRTADRRLASARRALGATSTSEALVLAHRAGIKPAE